MDTAGVQSGSHPFPEAFEKPCKLGKLCKQGKQNTVPASNFVGTIAVNVDNKKMSDADFRQFIRGSLSVVDYDSKCSCGKPGRPRSDKGLAAGCHCDDCWGTMVEEAREVSW